ncbi:MAG: type III PLP-dependent enzyme [Microthrixaceae bacterium]
MRTHPPHWPEPIGALARLDRDGGPTPVLALDISAIREQYHALVKAIPDAQVFYAMKANPHPAVLRALVDEGCGIDAASLNEIHDALKAGVAPGDISYGNPVRRASDVAAAHDEGVSVFTVDDESELDKVLRHAPGSLVSVRVLTDGDGAAWPLSRKFGTDTASATRLVQRARDAGHPIGMTFHVGSQQALPDAWDDALAAVAAALEPVHLDPGERISVNLGGGLPGRLDDPTPDLAAYADTIHRAIDRHLDRALVDLAIEPGRFLVSDAGVIETEVLGVVDRPGQRTTRWAFLDVGLFQGLSEVGTETIRYPITSDRVGPTVPTVLAGPTCDSTDVLYEQRPVDLPESLRSGDRLRLYGTGAYTVSCSTEFNGFEPLRVVTTEE